MKMKRRLLWCWAWRCALVSIERHCPSWLQSQLSFVGGDQRSLDFSTTVAQTTDEIMNNNLTWAQWYRKRIDLVSQPLNCFSVVTSGLSSCPVTQCLWQYWVRFHWFPHPYSLQPDSRVSPHLESIIINQWGSLLRDFFANIYYF